MSKKRTRREWWKPIPGYVGSYEVSDQGRVRSVDRWISNKRGPYFIRGKLLSPSISNAGYLYLVLSSRMWLVHRLVMLAFRGPCPKGREVLHLDAAKSNNKLRNLRYGTRSENLRGARVVRTDQTRSAKEITRRAMCKNGVELKGERWVAVPGFAASYEVSNLGRVKSFVRNSKGRILQTGLHTSGYPSTRIGTDVWLVHRLVMFSFRGPCPSGKEVCHNDGDPFNSRLSNLRYGTRKTNRRDMSKHGTQHRGETSPSSKLTATSVKAARKLYRSGKYSFEHLAKRFKVSAGALEQAVRGTTWAHIPGAVPASIHGPVSNSKLKDCDVLKMRGLYATGKYTLVDLGKKFSIDPSTAGDIVKGTIWKHLPGAILSTIKVKRYQGKLSLSERRRARRLYATGKYTYADLVPIFGVSAGTIGVVIRTEV